jgi:hypothetical protein
MLHYHDCPFFVPLWHFYLKPKHALALFLLGEAKRREDILPEVIPDA